MNENAVRRLDIAQRTAYIRVEDLDESTIWKIPAEHSKLTLNFVNGRLVSTILLVRERLSLNPNSNSVGHRTTRILETVLERKQIKALRQNVINLTDSDK